MPYRRLHLGWCAVKAADVVSRLRFRRPEIGGRLQGFLDVRVGDKIVEVVVHADYLADSLLALEGAQ